MGRALPGLGLCHFGHTLSKGHWESSMTPPGRESEPGESLSRELGGEWEGNPLALKIKVGRAVVRQRRERVRAKFLLALQSVCSSCSCLGREEVQGQHLREALCSPSSVGLRSWLLVGFLEHQVPCCAGLRAIGDRFVL